MHAMAARLVPPLILPLLTLLGPPHLLLPPRALLARALAGPRDLLLRPPTFRKLVPVHRAAPPRRVVQVRLSLAHPVPLVKLVLAARHLIVLALLFEDSPLVRPFIVVVFVRRTFHVPPRFVCVVLDGRRRVGGKQGRMAVALYAQANEPYDVRHYEESTGPLLDGPGQAILPAPTIFGIRRLCRLIAVYSEIGVEGCPLVSSAGS